MTGCRKPKSLIRSSGTYPSRCDFAANTKGYIQMDAFYSGSESIPTDVCVFAYLLLGPCIIRKVSVRLATPIHGVSVR